MTNVKVLISALFLSLVPYVSCQEPNDTIYIPAASLVAGELGTPTGAVEVSQVTVNGATTVLQVVEPLASGDLTATLDLSPSDALLSADIASIGAVAVTCAIAGGDSKCQVNAAVGGATVPITSFTEPTSGVPVVAVGVASASGSASGSSSPTAASSSGGTAATTSGSSASQTPAANGGSSNSTGSSSNSSSSSSPTSPAAPAASTTAPSSAMGLRGSLVAVLIGFGIVMASL